MTSQGLHLQRPHPPSSANEFAVLLVLGRCFFFVRHRRPLVSLSCLPIATMTHPDFPGELPGGGYCPELFGYTPVAYYSPSEAKPIKKSTLSLIYPISSLTLAYPSSPAGTP